MTTRSASASRSSKPRRSATRSKPGTRRAPIAASPPASPPAAPAPGRSGMSSCASRSRRIRTCSVVAPFCGAKTSAASRKRASTSHATSSCGRCAGSASTAPTPPSVLATPPTATTTFRAPSAAAAAMSSPTPRLVARSGSFPSGPPARESPQARATSTSAVPSSSRRHSASTGSPSGPVTVVCRLPPPRTSSVPSPPSASGSSNAVQPAHAAPVAIAAAAWRAVSVPRNLSGAARRRIKRGLSLPFVMH